MASDGRPVTIPTTSRVQGSQAPTPVLSRASGKIVPHDGTSTGKSATPPAARASDAAARADLQKQVNLLNKFVNDSGRAVQFRASQDHTAIQEINPATGDIVAEYSAAEFAALAKSVGISGAIVNELA